MEYPIFYELFIEYSSHFKILIMTKYYKTIKCVTYVSIVDIKEL